MRSTDNPSTTYVIRGGGTSSPAIVIQILALPVMCKLVLHADLRTILSGFEGWWTSLCKTVQAKETHGYEAPVTTRAFKSMIEFNKTWISFPEWRTCCAKAWISGDGHPLKSAVSFTHCSSPNGRNCCWAIGSCGQVAWLLPCHSLPYFSALWALMTCVLRCIKDPDWP
jgi:hypothetical protein